jgi:hypothetical protein
VGAVLAASSVALAAFPAAAVDGEILINEAKVNAGGITPGDTAGFPVTISRPGRYKLSGNLAVPAGISGIEVTANDVTIDLNGFTVRSTTPPGASNGGVVTPDDVAGLRVMNGTITGFGRRGGISNPGSGAVPPVPGHIENMRITSNAIGGGTCVQMVSGSHIRSSTIANCFTGITCFGCLVEHSIITGNASYGVIGGGSVSGNVVVGNGSVGLNAIIEALGYANNILVGNNSGGAQVIGPAFQSHPNVCDPACP